MQLIGVLSLISILMKVGRLLSTLDRSARSGVPRLVAYVACVTFKYDF